MVVVVVAVVRSWREELSMAHNHRNYHSLFDAVCCIAPAVRFYTVVSSSLSLSRSVYFFFPPDKISRDNNLSPSTKCIIKPIDVTATAGTPSETDG